MKITRKTSIADIVFQYPELVDKLHEEGLFCYSWGGRPAWGTLELQARLQGIRDIDGLIDELNAVLEKKQQEKQGIINNLKIW